eukprot:10456967-Ditylum_brightwellii.AAC.1
MYVRLSEKCLEEENTVSSCDDEDASKLSRTIEIVWSADSSVVGSVEDGNSGCARQVTLSQTYSGTLCTSASNQSLYSEASERPNVETL